MNQKIKVVDSIMGSGKTSLAIQIMNESPGTPYLYITPFLSEARRIVEGCPGLDFAEPEKRGSCQKSADLERLLAEGRNVSASHELFKRLTVQALENIRANGYTLIMDEVMSVLEVREEIKPKEFQAMLDADILRLEGSEGDKLRKVAAGDREDLTKYEDYYAWAKADRLVLFEGKVMLWLFPSYVFDHFSEVYNLCYLFLGQHQKLYYDLFDLEYEYYSVIRTHDGFRMVPHSPKYDAKVIRQARELINIYNGPRNNIGEPSSRNKNPLSMTWYRKHYKGKTGLLRGLQKNIRGYFRTDVQATSENSLWCVFKAFLPSKHNRKHPETIKVNGFVDSFLSKAVRSTNEYRDRKHLAYAINVFMKPEVFKFFKEQGVKIGQEVEDRFALSEMVQWIWRSQIRNDRWPFQNRKINLYVPSKRMRNLLQDWLGLNQT